MNPIISHYQACWPLLQNIVRKVNRPPVFIHATTGPIRDVIRPQSASMWNRDHTRYIAFEIDDIIATLLAIHVRFHIFFLKNWAGSHTGSAI